MIVRFNPRPEDLQHLQVGPLGPHLPSFATLVSQQGYCSGTGWLKVRLVAKLSRWLQQHRVPLSELNERQIAAFFKSRWKCLKRHVGDQTTTALLLRHLREANVVAPPPETGTGSDTDLLCEEYESFLLGERGLMPSSTENYLDVACRFLFERFPTGKVYLKKLRAGDVTDFLLHDSSNRGQRSVQLTATVLRSFFNFLFQKGRIPTNLAAAVPSVPHRRLAELPHYLEAREVERVLRSCDQRRKIGKRDYAIFLLLARLGLRAGEVAQLTLDDIDWRAGELLVRGKGARVDRLPLLQDVGQSLAEYLQKARPGCSSRRVFIQCKAPFEGFAGPQCVSNLVRMALIHLDLSPAHRGAHVLRHPRKRKAQSFLAAEPRYPVVAVKTVGSCVNRMKRRTKPSSTVLFQASNPMPPARFLQSPPRA